ncbi:hypothetical protein [Burkholderia aenigmatica]|uniref:hypothetical protein n=1 Tax=Burkholderia aenigmatica TaxID=2015348 RepID=UPI002654A922|nr:hypothetical protein [Burkholderia aenigmatica]MDN7879249.1 hypothetical protein [Burkholderia aenigmatica]
MKRWSILFCGLIFLSNVNAQEVARVLRCPLARDGTKSIEILTGHPIAGTYLYYLKRNKESPVPVYSGDEDQSRGEGVKYECAGSAEHVFVISGEFTSNYIQGVAIRYNVYAKEWERIDFSERARPTRIYLGRSGVLVVIPNLGNETSKKYIIYRYAADSGQTFEPAASNEMPEGNRNEVVFLKK